MDDKSNFNANLTQTAFHFFRLSAYRTSDSLKEIFSTFSQWWQDGN